MVHESSLVGCRGSPGGGEGGGEGKCSICLEPIFGEGFLDQCFHKFCYHCILQWSEMVISRPSSTSNPLQYLECPLCKTQYTSIIHDVSGAKFQRHYILTSRIPGLRKSEAHIRRQVVYSAHSGPAAPQLSRLTDSIPNPNRWISCWVQRELQALMQEEDVDTVMHHLVGIVESFSKRSKGKVGSSEKKGTKVEDFNWHATIAAAVRPFIFECAERFAVELESFLVSGLDIAAYDQKSKLAACGPEPATHSDEQITIPSLKKDFQSTYDLYDEDVDEEFGHVMVRKLSSEAERFSTEESTEMMKQHTRGEDAGMQERKSSRRELIESGKTKHDFIKDSVKDIGSNLDRGRSKHRSELRKKRRRSRSSSSRSSSPTRHKRRKSDKSVKNGSRKKRKHAKRKDKKALQEHKRKSHNSRSRKNHYTSSVSSSDSESCRSSRSLSPAERGARRKGRKKDQTFTEKAVSDKADHRKVPMLDVEKRTQERRRSHHYRSSSSESRKISEVDRSYERSPDNLGEHRQPGFSHRGGQGLERTDTYAVDADERSLTRPPEARFRTRHLSTSTSPRASAGRRSWDAHESSPTPPPRAMNDEQTVRPLIFSEISVQRSEVVEEDANALELKLRGQALANLLRHLSQKENATESTSVGNPEGSSAISKETQDFEAPSATKEMKPQTPLQGKSLDDGGQEDGKEVDNEGYLEINLRNVPEDAKHVEEGDEDAHSNTELTGPTKDDKLGTGYSKEARGSTQAGEEIMSEGGQSTGVSYGKATSLEGRDIVVELVVDTEPFDFDIPCRGSTPSLFTDDQRRKRKGKATRDLSREVTEGNSNGEEDHSGDGKVFVQQVCDPQLGVPVTQSPQPREGSVIRKELPDVETRECRNREELALVNPDNAAITGERARDVEDVERTDIAIIPQGSAKTESSSEKTRFSLNDVSRPESSPKVRNDGDEAGDSAKFQQKSMSVTRGGESIQVSYKVYIPQRATGARRRLQR